MSEFLNALKSGGNASSESSGIRAHAVKPRQRDDDGEAPVSVRAAVGSLVTPEDRLRELRKYAPDARPVGDDNFEYTDPKTGKITMYNKEGWIPSAGDVVSAIPEIAEGVGSLLGGIGGGIVGTAAGPVGTVGGAAAGAGVAGAGAKDLVRRAMQFATGADDTRSASDQLADAGIDLAVNAGGELVGPLAKYGFNRVVKPALVAKNVDDIVRQAKDLGVNDELSTLEVASPFLKGTIGTLDRYVPFASGVVDDRSARLAGALNREAGNTVKGAFDQNVPTKLFGGYSEAGRAVMGDADAALARMKGDAEAAYSDVASTLGGVSGPMRADNVERALAAELAGRSHAGSGEMLSSSPVQTMLSTFDDALRVAKEKSGAPSYELLDMMYKKAGEAGRDKGFDHYDRNALKAVKDSIASDIGDTLKLVDPSYAGLYDDALSEYASQVPARKAISDLGMVVGEDNSIIRQNANALGRNVTDLTRESPDKLMKLVDLGVIDPETARRSAATAMAIPALKDGEVQYQALAKALNNVSRMPESSVSAMGDIIAPGGAFDDRVSAIRSLAPTVSQSLARDAEERTWRQMAPKYGMKAGLPTAALGLGAFAGPAAATAGLAATGLGYGLQRGLMSDAFRNYLMKGTQYGLGDAARNDIGLRVLNDVLAKPAARGAFEE